jgi:hypothetical protein
MGSAIDQLIINSPFEEPTKHWRYQRRWGAFAGSHRGVLS